jgi:hypothetical protein
MTHPGWGALAEEPSCGREGCFVHRLNNDVIQDKWYGKAFAKLVMDNYTVAQINKLKAVSNGMG